MQFLTCLLNVINISNVNATGEKKFKLKNCYTCLDLQQEIHLCVKGGAYGVYQIMTSPTRSHPNPQSL